MRRPLTDRSGKNRRFAAQTRRNKGAAATPDRIEGAPMRTVAAGSTTCTETTPGNCKVVNYPRTMAATGRVCGNTVSIDVLINGGFGVGLPIRNQLYNVTAFSFGRNDANDLYAGRQPPCDLALGDLHAEPLCGLLQLGAVGEQAGSWLPTFSSCALPCSGK